MGAMKNLIHEVNDSQGCCFHCGRYVKALDYHHEPYRSQGNPAKRGEIPLCKRCHKLLHSERGDFAQWGRKGGQRTAQNPENWQRNLKQYRGKQ